MALKESLERVRTMFEGTSLDSRLPPHYPPAAVEIAPGLITGVRVARERRGARTAVVAVARAPIPPDALDVSLVRPNIHDPAAIGTALDEVLRVVARGENRISLLLPDHAARVSLLNFAALPSTRKELAEMVRFRIAKGLPFKVEEAVMDLMPLASKDAASAGAVLAVFMHRPVLEQYEALLTARGYWPGLVGLSTLELFNLFRRRLETGLHERDLLMLNLTPQYLSLLILSTGTIIFYRCRPLAVESQLEGGLAGVRREIYTSLAFYQEKLLGRGLGRVWLRVAGLPAGPALAAVREEAGCPVEELRLSEAVPAAAGVELDEEAAALAAPSAGAVLGRRA